ncbi:MAG: hypothetical protein C6Y20_09940 [Tagaea sp. CACIAM 22H2]|nr:hypothetical protein [Tagaea sp. CACIAM 22H2]
MVCRRNHHRPKTTDDRRDHEIFCALGVDLLREKIGFAAQQIMELEVCAATGIGCSRCVRAR